VAVAPTVLGMDGADVVPPDAVVFRVTKPKADAMVHVPKALAGQLEVNPEDQRWMDRFLAHAITDPAMTEEQVRTLLGPDRDVLAEQLLQVWNWLPIIDDDGRSTFPHLPAPIFMAVLSACVQAYGIPASDILRDWTFPDLMLNYRVAVHRPEKNTDYDDFTRRVGIEA
jgi:hypothetical protein